MKYVVTNFAYGTGPFLRTTELVVAFNNELERRGHERMPAIIPFVYGEKQRRVMLEEFAAYDAAHPGHLLLDKKLGELLGSVFYADSTYEEALRKWVGTAGELSQRIEEHLSGEIEVETLSGEKRMVNGRDIALEINRSPRVRYGVAPSYSTTFGYIADILEASLAAPEGAILADKELLRKGARLADSIEGAQALNLMAYPGTFSWLPDYRDRYNATLVPPITDLPKESSEEMEEGLYVTITGIPGLERLYSEARELGLKLYSNDTKAVEGATKALPHVIPNPAMKLQFARSGWGSVWLSMFCGTPIVVPQFDGADDPEIYFNNKAVEGMGIGVVYRSQPLSEILTQGEAVRAAQQKMREDILARFGTLNGNDVCAELMVEKFLA